MDNEQKKTRRGVLLLIAAATVLFFAALWGVCVLRERIPQRRAEKIEALLESGDAAAARPLIGRVDDEALAESFLARCDYLDAEAAFARGDWSRRASSTPRPAALRTASTKRVCATIAAPKSYSPPARSRRRKRFSPRSAALRTRRTARSAAATSGPPRWRARAS